jgi:hypothetical protein
LKDRKKELEADARDREKETKLLEDIKQKLIAGSFLFCRFFVEFDQFFPL